ncbi:hypothetical protein BU16DRAFT_583175 [Lophium mytilinum]|uniref:F-box domain-containing protein n=1 Tax=Lophium mytilinum TaxID=390894 RepID=A0A6A6QTI8_9PEZI|nr:hypothetical protein BU16DRAFT_583175 [Lophium mytilinum]
MEPATSDPPLNTMETDTSSPQLPIIDPRLPHPQEPASLATLPLELLFEIYSHLLAPLPTHYSYTTAPARAHSAHDNRSQNLPAPRGLPPPPTTTTTTEPDPPKPPLRTHAILLTSHALSTHYCTAFYARTNFFFHLSAANFPSAPWFTLPPAALRRVRACKLYIEADEIARTASLPSQPTPAAERVRVLGERVAGFLTGLETLRRVQVVWDVGVGRETAYERRKGGRVRVEGLDWEGLGEGPCITQVPG